MEKESLVEERKEREKGFVSLRGVLISYDIRKDFYYDIIEFLFTFVLVIVVPKKFLER